MFCPKCGKELPGGAKFCAHCGKSILGGEQQSPDQVTMQDYIASNQDSNYAGGDKPQKSVILPRKGSKNTKVFIGLIVVLVLVIGVVFAVRLFNEQAMIQEIPYAIFNDGGSDKVEAYYKDYFGESVMVGYSAEDFSITRGTDSNSYNLTGKFEATDLSQDSRPTYNAYVVGTVTTDFFRAHWSVDWNLQYQVPEDQNVISIETLFHAYHSNAALADNTYANQYLNVSGTITNICNTYSNTVEVELGIPTELFYALFEFSPNDTALYNLQVGNQTTLTGFLEPGGNTYTLHFSNASLYQRNTSHNETNTPSSSADFPPTFTPIEGEGYSDHLGEYIDEYGRVLVVGVGTGEGVNYFINIYANQADAINNASPLLTASHGTLEYRNGYMIIVFENSSGNGLYFERDNFIENNYTLYVHGSPYVDGCDMEPFLDTTFYMTEQYIDPMT